MTQKIRSQASRFWSVLASASTLTAYKNAIDVTFTILKEGIVLIWLVLCLVLVFFDWGAEKSTLAGQRARSWFDNLQNADSTQIASNAKQTLLSASKASVVNTIAQARQQLGLPEKEAAPESATTPQPNVVAAQPTVTVPSVSPTSATNAEAVSTDT